MGSFKTLCKEAHVCSRCPELAERSAVLSMQNGPVPAALMFIAEAPGRLGADRTGIPLSGDASGRNFLKFLEFARIEREDCFITNAVLCNPRNNSGNNRRPNVQELSNCKDFLRRQIEAVSPEVIVTLGAVALDSLSKIESHELKLSEHVCQPTAWFGRILWPMYHPAPRAMIHRPKRKQIEDYARLKAFLRRTIKGAAPILDMAGRQT